MINLNCSISMFITKTNRVRMSINVRIRVSRGQRE